ncbi:MAG: hypothetical protein Alpg2KO_19910 [Alphaproteobacteria bacterium]
MAALAVAAAEKVTAVAALAAIRVANPAQGVDLPMALAAAAGPSTAATISQTLKVPILAQAGFVLNCCDLVI